MNKDKVKGWSKEPAKKHHNLIEILNLQFSLSSYLKLTHRRKNLVLLYTHSNY